MIIRYQDGTEANVKQIQNYDGDTASLIDDNGNNVTVRTDWSSPERYDDAEMSFEKVKQLSMDPDVFTRIKAKQALALEFLNSSNFKAYQELGTKAKGEFANILEKHSNDIVIQVNGQDDHGRVLASFTVNKGNKVYSVKDYMIKQGLGYERNKAGDYRSQKIKANIEAGTTDYEGFDKTIEAGDNSGPRIGFSMMNSNDGMELSPAATQAQAIEFTSLAKMMDGKGYTKLIEGVLTSKDFNNTGAKLKWMLERNYQAYGIDKKDLTDGKMLENLSKVISYRLAAYAASVGAEEWQNNGNPNIGRQWLKTALTSLLSGSDDEQEYIVNKIVSFEGTVGESDGVAKTFNRITVLDRSRGNNIVLSDARKGEFKWFMQSAIDSFLDNSLLGQTLQSAGSAVGITSDSAVRREVLNDLMADSDAGWFKAGKFMSDMTGTIGGLFLDNVILRKVKIGSTSKQTISNGSFNTMIKQSPMLNYLGHGMALPLMQSYRDSKKNPLQEQYFYNYDKENHMSRMFAGVLQNIGSMYVGDKIGSTIEAIAKYGFVHKVMTNTWLSGKVSAWNLENHNLYKALAKFSIAKTELYGNMLPALADMGANLGFDIASVKAFNWLYNDVLEQDGPLFDHMTDTMYGDGMTTEGLLATMANRYALRVGNQLMARSIKTLSSKQDARLEKKNAPEAFSVGFWKQTRGTEGKVYGVKSDVSFKEAAFVKMSHLLFGNSLASLDAYAATRGLTFKEDLLNFNVERAQYNDDGSIANADKIKRQVDTIASVLTFRWLSVQGGLNIMSTMAMPKMVFDDYNITGRGFKRTFTKVSDTTDSEIVDLRTLAKVVNEGLGGAFIGEGYEAIGTLGKIHLEIQSGVSMNRELVNKIIKNDVTTENGVKQKYNEHLADKLISKMSGDNALTEEEVRVGVATMIHNIKDPNASGAFKSTLQQKVAMSDLDAGVRQKLLEVLAYKSDPDDTGYASKSNKELLNSFKSKTNDIVGFNDNLTNERFEQLKTSLFSLFGDDSKVGPDGKTEHKLIAEIAWKVGLGLEYKDPKVGELLSKVRNVIKESLNSGDLEQTDNFRDLMINVNDIVSKEAANIIQDLHAKAKALISNDVSKLSDADKRKVADYVDNATFVARLTIGNNSVIKSISDMLRDANIGNAINNVKPSTGVSAETIESLSKQTGGENAEKQIHSNLAEQRLSSLISLSVARDEFLLSFDNNKTDYFKEIVNGYIKLDETNASKADVVRLIRGGSGDIVSSDVDKISVQIGEEPSIDVKLSGYAMLASEDISNPDVVINKIASLAVRASDANKETGSTSGLIDGTSIRYTVLRTTEDGVNRYNIAINMDYEHVANHGERVHDAYTNATTDVKRIRHEVATKYVIDKGAKVSHINRFGNKDYDGLMDDIYRFYSGASLDVKRIARIAFDSGMDIEKIEALVRSYIEAPLSTKNITDTIEIETFTTKVISDALSYVNEIESISLNVDGSRIGSALSPDVFRNVFADANHSTTKGRMIVLSLPEGTDEEVAQRAIQTYISKDNGIYALGQFNNNLYWAFVKFNFNIHDKTEFNKYFLNDRKWEGSYIEALVKAKTSDTDEVARAKEAFEAACKADDETSGDVAPILFMQKMLANVGKGIDSKLTEIIGGNKADKANEKLVLNSDILKEEDMTNILKSLDSTYSQKVGEKLDAVKASLGRLKAFNPTIANESNKDIEILKKMSDIAFTMFSAGVKDRDKLIDVALDGASDNDKMLLKGIISEVKGKSDKELYASIGTLLDGIGSEASKYVNSIKTLFSKIGYNLDVDSPEIKRSVDDLQSYIESIKKSLPAMYIDNVAYKALLKRDSLTHSVYAKNAKLKAAQSSQKLVQDNLAKITNETVSNTDIQESFLRFLAQGEAMFYADYPAKRKSWMITPMFDEKAFTDYIKKQAGSKPVYSFYMDFDKGDGITIVDSNILAAQSIQGLVAGGKVVFDNSKNQALSSTSLNREQTDAIFNVFKEEINNASEIKYTNETFFEAVYKDKIGLNVFAPQSFKGLKLNIMNDIEGKGFLGKGYDKKGLLSYVTKIATHAYNKSNTTNKEVARQLQNSTELCSSITHSIISRHALEKADSISGDIVSALTKGPTEFLSYMKKINIGIDMKGASANATVLSLTKGLKNSTDRETVLIDDKKADTLRTKSHSFITMGSISFANFVLDNARTNLKILKNGAELIGSLNRLANGGRLVLSKENMTTIMDELVKMDIVAKIDGVYYMQAVRYPVVAGGNHAIVAFAGIVHGSVGFNVSRELYKEGLRGDWDGDYIQVMELSIKDLKSAANDDDDKTAADGDIGSDKHISAMITRATQAIYNGKADNGMGGFGVEKGRPGAEEKNIGTMLIVSQNAASYLKSLGKAYANTLYPDGKTDISEDLRDTRYALESTEVKDKHQDQSKILRRESKYLGKSKVVVMVDVNNADTSNPEIKPYGYLGLTGTYDNHPDHFAAISKEFSLPNRSNIDKYKFFSTQGHTFLVRSDIENARGLWKIVAVAKGVLSLQDSKVVAPYANAMLDNKALTGHHFVNKHLITPDTVDSFLDGASTSAMKTGVVLSLMNQKTQAAAWVKKNLFKAYAGASVRIDLDRDMISTVAYSPESLKPTGTVRIGGLDVTDSGYRAVIEDIVANKITETAEVLTSKNGLMSYDEWEGLSKIANRQMPTDFEESSRLAETVFAFVGSDRYDMVINHLDTATRSALKPLASMAGIQAKNFTAAVKQRYGEAIFGDLLKNDTRVTYDTIKLITAADNLHGVLSDLTIDKVIENPFMIGKTMTDMAHVMDNVIVTTQRGYTKVNDLYNEVIKVANNSPLSKNLGVQVNSSGKVNIVEKVLSAYGLSLAKVNDFDIKTDSTTATSIKKINKALAAISDGVEDQRDLVLGVHDDNNKPLTVSEFVNKMNWAVIKARELDNRQDEVVLNAFMSMLSDNSQYLTVLNLKGFDSSLFRDLEASNGVLTTKIVKQLTDKNLLRLWDETSFKAFLMNNSFKIKGRCE